ncbi:MAG TPA: COX15/CtaA family protein [Candidatus Acidoferrum sp.]|nr:COX15/CtaA family protein [Candidatus Acidoferrum sp.]
MADNSTFRGVHNFAVATAGSTILVLVAGALVTSNDAADSVPDWPLAYGRIIPPLIGGIRYEFAHRVVAGLVAILTVALAIWISLSKLRGSARRWAWVAVALVVVQALLGAARVLLGHAAFVATIHATVAQIFFITVVSLTMFTSEWWQRDLPLLEDAGAPKLRALSVWLTAVILVQLVLGAGFRHGAFGILPHLLGFLVVTWMVIWTARIANKRFGQVADVRRWVVMLHSTFGTQVILGFLAYWAVSQARLAAQPVLLYTVIEVAHVVMGALVLASSVLLALTCNKLIRGTDAVAVESGAARSQAQGSRA